VSTPNFPVHPFGRRDGRSCVVTDRRGWELGGEAFGVPRLRQPRPLPGEGFDDGEHAIGNEEVRFAEHVLAFGLVFTSEDDPASLAAG